ncbi:Metastasis suppressor protein 1 [Armadillidium nasatum]|uniref:Metastasis suppressor protein 1 n=1 Tax=Armadillidium nasatum TaxID=96803 RepID=A0A5N5TNG5_9CRUS|nr:Metastasis suppressor protein 1 [Armadillidium nasatum]
MEQLEKHSANPHVLPPASEQVLEDIKSGDTKWSWQTPPSSPASSLGSRKSSMCSISSLNSSSSSSTHSPSHHARARSGMRLVSGSSQDSGFTSQDMLNRPIRPISFAFPKATGLSETSCSDGSHTPSPAAPATATWPNLTDSTLQHKSASATGLHMLTDRPHTISSAYERGKDRPPLTVYTFQPPDGRAGAGSPQISSQPVSPVCYEIEEGNISPLVSHTATISRRSSRTSLQQNLSSSSQESLSNKPKPPIPNRCSSLERPSIPDKKMSVRHKQQQQLLLHDLQTKEQLQQQALIQKLESHTLMTSSQNSTSSTLPDFHKAAPDMVLPQPLYSNMSELKSDLAGSHPITVLGEKNEDDEGSSHASVGSSGYGSQPNMNVDHMSRLEDCEASKYCTMRPHSLAVFPQSLIYPSQDYCNSGYINSRTGSLRRGQKPPPPVRRTSSITSTTPLSSLTMNAFPNNGLRASASNASLSSSTSTVHSSPLYGRDSSAASPGQSSSNNSSANISPLQKTDSESSTPVGSMENLPPPPAFLLEEGTSIDDDNTTPEGVLATTESFKSQIQDETIQLRRISVSETIRSLQDSCHQPSSPITHRRTQSLRMSAPPPQLKKPSIIPDDRKHSIDGPRAALMSSLNAKLAITNPVIGSLQRQKSPIQQIIPIYAQNPVQKGGSSSPKLRRNRLTSVQEGVVFGNNNQTLSNSQVKEISSFRGKPLSVQPHLEQSLNSSADNSPRSSPLMTRGENMENRGQSKRAPTSHDPFIQSLNMVLAQRVGGDQPTPASTSPKIKHKRKSVGSVNGTSANASLQRSGSTASEKASKVRNWISSMKSQNSEVSASSLRESLLDQIRKGTVLRRPKYVADRSAPRVH